jgi:hypothetical protein
MCIQRRKSKWFRHVLHRNCLLKYLIEGKIVRRRRRKKLPDDLKEKTDAGTLRVKLKFYNLKKF